MKRRSTLFTAVAVTLLLGTILAQMVFLARRNSATWDEPDHLYSAYMQGKGDFVLNPEHPPLVKFLAALPLYHSELNLPPLLNRIYRLEEAVGGRTRQL